MYQLTSGDTIVRLSDNAYIPTDPKNQDYFDYLSWLEEGNEPLLPEEEPITWESIRAKRDQLIRESDWTMVQDASVDQSQWSAYRQILRDLPQTYAASGSEFVVWPTAPSTAGPNTTPVE
jgi:hypothetical protein